MEHGTLRLARYLERLSGDDPPYAQSTDAMLDEWTGKGFAVFGRLTLGTPDDAIEEIRRLERQSGGFGTLLLLGHDCADPAATLKSYELFVRYVIPAVNDLNRTRSDSLDRAHAKSGHLVGKMMDGVAKSIREREAEGGEQGEDTRWNGGGSGS